MEQETYGFQTLFTKFLFGVARWKMECGKSIWDGVTTRFHEVSSV